MGWEVGTGTVVIAGRVFIPANIGRLLSNFINSSMGILDVGHARRYRVFSSLGLASCGSIDITESGR